MTLESLLSFCPSSFSDGEATSASRGRLEDRVHLLFCQQCEISLFSFCCNIDLHMSLFIPECNCFISLIVKYHIKILCAPFIKVLESSGVLFWVFLSSPELCTSPSDWFHPALTVGVSWFYWEKVAVFPLCLLVWLHHDTHSHSGGSYSEGTLRPRLGQCV